MWYGWIEAGVNSLLICIIGARTDQSGFIPANVFCIALYSYNLWAWRKNSDYANHFEGAQGEVSGELSNLPDQIVSATAQPRS